MNRIGKTLLLLSTFGLGYSVHAIAPDRYETIVDRNIFRLTSPPPPAAPVTNNEALDRNIELSGISNIGGKKKAWFIVKPKGAKESLYMNLGENEGQDFLQVLSISEEEGEVKILNSGNSMVLSFKNNAPKAVTAGAAPPTLPIPGVPATALTSPQQSQAPANYANAAPSYNSGGSSVTVSGGTPAPVSQTAEGGLRTIPTRTLRLAPVSQPQPAPQLPEVPVSPQKQLENMQIQKAVYDAAGIPLPPIPQ